MARCKIMFLRFIEGLVEYKCLEHLQPIMTERGAPVPLYCDVERERFMNREEEGNAAAAIQSE